MVGGTLSRSEWWGVPHVRSQGGTPARSGWWGVPHPRRGTRYTPQPGLDGGGYPSEVLTMGGTWVPPPHIKAWLGYPRPWDGVPPTIKTWLGYPPTPWDGVPPQPGMGYPPIKTWLGYPPPWDGVPPPTWDGVPPLPPRQSSIASTCYAAGGMPLAFTQEDFLVPPWFWCAGQTSAEVQNRGILQFLLQIKIRALFSSASFLSVFSVSSTATGAEPKTHRLSAWYPK